MRGPTRQPEGYAPTQRSRECEREQNREFRRSVNHMTEGQRRAEMRLMYIEIGKFALKVGDQAIMLTLTEKYLHYTRPVRPEVCGIKRAHAEMSRWYDEVRKDYLAAHMEDNLNG